MAPPIAIALASQMYGRLWNLSRFSLVHHLSAAIATAAAIKTWQTHAKNNAPSTIVIYYVHQQHQQQPPLPYDNLYPITTLDHIITTRHVLFVIAIANPPTSPDSMHKNSLANAENGGINVNKQHPVAREVTVLPMMKPMNASCPIHPTKPLSLHPPRTMTFMPFHLGLDLRNIVQ